jgi:hypothetical protein
VEPILKEERVISSRPLEATAFQIEIIRMAYLFYASGLAINVIYTIDDLRSGLSGSSSLKAWKFQSSLPRGSSLPPRSQGWLALFAVRTLRSKETTDPR